MKTSQSNLFIRSRSCKCVKPTPKSKVMRFGKCDCGAIEYRPPEKSPVESCQAYGGDMVEAF